MTLQINSKIKSAAPGKLLISGEYSALFGSPVISAAISKRVETSIQLLKPHDASDINVMLDVPSLSFKENFSIKNLFLTVKEINTRYSEFKKSKLPSYKILQEKIDLVKYIVGFYLLQKSVNYDIYCLIKSDIEMNLGFGSSASVINSLSFALVKLLELNYKQHQIEYTAQDIENLQHGYSSGVDLITSREGGVLKIHDNQITKLNIHEEIVKNFFIIKLPSKENTSHTVKYVVDNFTKNDKLWNDFTNVSLEIEKNIQTNNLDNLIENIKDNNLLLKKISVVSNMNQEIISSIENSGGAAKISGSGSLTQNLCGIIIAISNLEIIKKLSKQYNFTFDTLKLNYNGTECFI